MRVYAVAILIVLVCCGVGLADSAFQPFTNTSTTKTSGWHKLDDDNQRIQVVGYGSYFTGSTTIPGETAFRPFTSSTVKMEFANNTTMAAVPVKTWTTDFYDIVTVLKGYIRFVFTRSGSDAMNVEVSPRRDN